jgi:hypothetical protein
MTTETIFQLLAAVTGLAGSVMLAISLNKVLNEIGFAIDALSTSIQSLASARHIYVFNGIETRINKAKRISNFWVRGGITFVVVSALLTSASIFFGATSAGS